MAQFCPGHLTPTPAIGIGSGAVSKLTVFETAPPHYSILSSVDGAGAVMVRSAHIVGRVVFCSFVILHEEQMMRFLVVFLGCWLAASGMGFARVTHWLV